MKTLRSFFSLLIIVPIISAFYLGEQSDKNPEQDNGGITLPAFKAVSIYSYNQIHEQEVPKKNVNPASVETGEQLYNKYCLACHQANGNGMRNMFPPLTGNEKIKGPPKEIIQIVLFGLTGPVIVNGKEYDQVMPAQDYLTDKQIADILTFIRSSWGNKASSVKPEDVAKIRKEGKPPEE